MSEKNYTIRSNEAVNCKSEAEAGELVRLMHESGYRWFTGRGEKTTNYTDCRTVYVLEDGYVKVGSVTSHRHKTILTLDEWKEQQAWVYIVECDSVEQAQEVAEVAKRITGDTEDDKWGSDITCVCINSGGTSLKWHVNTKAHFDENNPELLRVPAAEFLAKHCEGKPTKDKPTPEQTEVQTSLDEALKKRQGQLNTEVELAKEYTARAKQSRAEIKRIKEAQKVWSKK